MQKMRTYLANLKIILLLAHPYFAVVLGSAQTLYRRKTSDSPERCTKASKENDCKLRNLPNYDRSKYSFWKFIFFWFAFPCSSSEAIKGEMSTRFPLDNICI